jgi:hypothetical protein
MASRKQQAICIGAVSCLLVAMTTTNASARSDEFMNNAGQTGHDSALVSSDQMLDLGTSTSASLRLEGEQSMRFNNIERAIMVLQKAVEMAPSDMDGHILYAQALEKKLTKQKDRDPVLYNFVVKQWLYVAKKADFLDQSMQGKTHLFQLTGEKLHRWEPEGHYLSRVLMVANPAVATKPQAAQPANKQVAGKAQGAIH